MRLIITDYVAIMVSSNSIIEKNTKRRQTMFIEERQQQIAKIISEDGKITVGFITAEFGISEESARRDLRILEQKGLCQRTHGGAIKLGQPIEVVMRDPINVRPPADRDFDSMPVFDNYREISAKAVKMIHENDTIYLTGGSFGYLMSTLIPRDIKFTVVVNSVDIANRLRRFDNIDVYVAGGKMRQNGSLVDSLASEFVSRMHFDISFITGAGLTAEFGLSNGTDETASFQRTVIRNSRRSCLLIPSGKVGTDSFIKVCEADRFDTIITDWNCSEEQISAFEEKEIKVVVVEEPKAD